MANNAYFKLDDVGMAGVTKKRSRSEIERDMQATAAFIKAHKQGKAIDLIPSKIAPVAAGKRNNNAKK